LSRVFISFPTFLKKSSPCYKIGNLAAYRLLSYKRGKHLASDYLGDNLCVEEVREEDWAAV